MSNKLELLFPQPPQTLGTVDKTIAIHKSFQKACEYLPNTDSRRLVMCEGKFFQCNPALWKKIMRMSKETINGSDKTLIFKVRATRFRDSYQYQVSLS